MRQGNELILLTVNYLTAALISGIIFLTSDSSSYSGFSLAFGIVLGLLFVIGFLSFSRAVDFAGASLAAVSSRLSVIVPIFLSVLIYNEYPGLWQIFGITAALITVILFYFSSRSKVNSGSGSLAFIFLIIALVFIGINDFSMKVFMEWRPEGEKQFFLTIVFFFAFVYSFSYSVTRRYKFDKQIIIRGILLGIPNLLSSVFLISALRNIPSIIVFPFIGIGVILLTTFASMIIWKERMNITGYIAILVGILSVILLGF